MADTKEIQKRMKSIQDTMKITNAMYMISSSKLRGAKKKLEETEPYFFLLQRTFSRFLRHIPEAVTHYVEPPDVKEDVEKRHGYIVITADKGLAGAYNHNVFKMAHELLNAGKNNRLFVVGELGRQYFAKEKVEVDTQFHYTVQNPTFSRARTIAERVLSLYESGELDEVSIIYTKLENAITMEVEVLRLLPLKLEDFHTVSADIYQESWTAYPSWNHVINHMVKNYVSGIIYGSLVESYASEQTSRMTAMEAATKSAKDMMQMLSIEYNRSRQAMITQELTEVISGAKAQKRKKRS
ncbi:MAG: ATP synthase F1 subunit gamma [Lachnospiraceae bacterium]|nr:ATP synthase F1 subunit gamma [Lachnospiraceae bacterium]